ncbi:MULTISPECIES: phosphate ABC transporter permease subunit PstC [Mesorhizobium]|jgi:phosphate transport system permease protein|uniref:phosphate ABC transporter permease subunit PstC n=4 Tax=Phyllobacteriaceae TaxID=69277 RepID=UPI000FCC0801|nr:MULTISPECIES: phosphate ABC transporter permease subunit PstC [Mesorhizobium]RUU11329.1 phosphate ABC transporter permease subunit PstC [Mesorhizobium sp. M7A.T.Ca.TU.009.01.3.2]RUU94521.1 phosphate ABC transporter permease subunit PstC [Mesorhizobium sp. M7A.T.Ca.TU.009.01.3.1]RVB30189.1 phosphate ABC transporter permease subunit PstC [Mesorhizobium sp. M7A.F.Ca.CA.004.05.1.1]MCF6127820.1 phosphate ABC transporter permease subunit PstC [Mesorhizobium ciceri]MCQ8815960.1 phosphate ABC trans
MSSLLVLAIVVAVGLVAFFIGRQRAAAQDNGKVKPHSRAHYHGWWAFLLAVLPALLLLAVWTVGSSVYLDRHIHTALPERTVDSKVASEALDVSLVKSLARGLRKLDAGTLAAMPASFAELQPLLAAKGVALASDTQDYMIPIAVEANKVQDRLGLFGAIVILVSSIAGAFYALRQIEPRARARNNVERLMLWGLLAASTIAILTTIGIVLSMLFQTITFFESVSPMSFFFGTVWDPRFAAAGSGGSQGQFGLIPLLAGTLYIAAVALLVAVPVGLMSAVYMAEYATPKVRSVVKPALELLAGIPTIVYGIFAVVTLGPFLRDLSAALTGGSPFIQGQSIFTAGLVMGVMLIPVVSSLSDDIITAVPRAMRDGSLGLGATRSETIKRVILPAALPGIVGAILLTASRAIGETMIVVLAAGVAANLTINPFEAMTTITVKIVNQLTGDLEFNSPQTLVAFALGLTLFALTLVMNIVALYIVRKYREQYE